MNRPIGTITPTSPSQRTGSERTAQISPTTGVGSTNPRRPHAVTTLSNSIGGPPTDFGTCGTKYHAHSVPIRTAISPPGSASGNFTRAKYVTRITASGGIATSGRWKI